MIALNPAGWITTFAPGAEHALIGGIHFVVNRGSAMELGGEPFGRFDTDAEAKAACHGYAMGKAGNAEMGILGNEWGCHGTVTRNVG